MKDLTKIARRLFYFFIVIFPVFYIPDSIVSNVLDKKIFALVFLSIIFSLYLIDIIRRGEIKARKSILSLGMGIFLLVSFISTCLSKNFYHSFIGRPEQVDSFICFLIYGAIFFLAANLLQKEEQVRRFLKYLLVGSGILSIMFLVQHFWPTYSVFSIFSSLALYLSLSFIIFISLISDKDRNKKFIFRLLRCLFGLLLLASIVLINFSTAWFFLSIGSFFLLWGAVSDKIYKERNPKIIFSFLFVIISLVFFMGQFDLGTNYIEEESALSHFLSAEITKATLAENTTRLLFGSGPANFEYQFLLHKDTILNRIDMEPAIFNQGISGFYTILTTLGILGTLSLLFVFAIFAARGFYRLINKVSRKGFEVLIFSLGFSSILLLFFYKIDLLIMSLVFLSLGLWVANSKKVEEIDFKNSNPKKIFLITAPIYLSLFFIISLNYVFIRDYIAEYFYEKAVTEDSEGDRDSAIGFLEKSVSWQKKDSAYIGLSQLNLLKSKEFYDQSIDMETTDEEKQNAEEEMNALARKSLEYALGACEINNNYYINWKNLGNVYANRSFLGEDNSEQALEAYTKASELAPNNPDNYIAMARVYEMQDNEDALFDVYEKIVLVDPNNQTYFTKWRNLNIKIYGGN